MIPAAFDYVRPGSVEEAVAALTEAGEDAKVLAGGQSLLPVLRLRLGYPSVLVDLGRIEALRGVRDEGDTVAIGAMTTHHEVMTDPLVRERCALLATATATVADPAVRHRGTLGGSLAHADPAGDLPAVALALDAALVVEGPAGRRTIPATEFFRDYLTTALEPGELLVEVRIPSCDSTWSFDYQKFHRVAQAWAIVGVAAAVRRSDGTIAEARIGLTNMGPTPLRATATEAALAGAPARADALRSAAGSADEGTEPTADLNARPDYRRHLARVLTRRALENAIGV